MEEYAHLEQRILNALPCFVKHLIVIERPSQAVAPFLEKHLATVTTLVPDTPLPIAHPGSADGLLILQSDTGEVDQQCIEDGLSLLQPDGIVLLYTPTGAPAESYQRVLEKIGLRHYPLRRPVTPLRYTLVEYTLRTQDPTEGYGSFWVQEGYEPLAHAQKLCGEHRNKEAQEVLESIPESYLQDPTQQLLVALEQQLLLFQLAVEAPPQQRLDYFFWAQQAFYHVQNLHPEYPPSYIAYAQQWHLLGDVDMAKRALRTIIHVTQDATAQHFLSHMPPCAPPVQRDWTPPARDEMFHPRILLLNFTSIDCGVDTLYDGLCRLFGNEYIVEYPWKPTLHGAKTDSDIRHPVEFSYSNTACSLEECEAKLRENYFDLIVFADVLEVSPREEMCRLIHANPAIPLVLLDTHDDGRDRYDEICKHIQTDRALIYFKREMLRCYDYGPKTLPLPLAYRDSYLPDTLQFKNRPNPIFWAGHRHSGTRRICLSYLEKKHNEDWNRIYPADKYIKCMQSSRIGIDLFGFGFDTVRYWELPAHGCMLLAERRPIHLPNDFEDGYSAVLFDHLPDLEEKLSYYINHPEECQSIAERGHRHMREYHTATARARYFLDWIGYCLHAVLH